MQSIHDHELSLSGDESAFNRRALTMVAITIAALLLAIVVAGVIAIIENARVMQTTERALSFDVEIEDEGDDLRVAVLDLRHMHRNFVFSDASPGSLADFDDAYTALLEEIDELERLDVSGLSVPQPARIRELATRYYDEFRPIAERGSDNPQAFQIGSNVGLSRLGIMDAAASEIDELGERLAAESLARVEQAARTEQLMLSGLILGTLAVGATLAIAAARLLTRLRALYEQEQRGRQALTRALQSKTDFIADASHELRTPLAVILGNAETAIASNDAKLHVNSLVAVASEARRMGKLVDDLLFLARADSGVPSLECEYVPSRWLISRIIPPGEMLARQHLTHLATDVRSEGYLEVDPARIEQAVLALIDNAARHSAPGDRVELVTGIDEQTFLIEVVDQGPGIPPAELPYVFDRFYQVRNRRNRKRGSSGLGLSIAQTIVDAHRGIIVAVSEVGCGTRMTIRLPLSPSPDILVARDIPAAIAVETSSMSSGNGTARRRGHFSSI